VTGFRGVGAAAFRSAPVILVPFINNNNNNNNYYNTRTSCRPNFSIIIIITITIIIAITYNKFRLGPLVSVASVRRWHRAFSALLTFYKGRTVAREMSCGPRTLTASCALDTYSNACSVVTSEEGLFLINLLVCKIFRFSNEINRYFDGCACSVILIND